MKANLNPLLVSSESLCHGDNDQPASLSHTCAHFHTVCAANQPSEANAGGNVLLISSTLNPKTWLLDLHTVCSSHTHTHQCREAQAQTHKISLAIHANLKENDLLISKTLKPLDRPLKAMPSRGHRVYRERQDHTGAQACVEEVRLFSAACRVVLGARLCKQNRIYNEEKLDKLVLSLNVPSIT